MKSGQANMSSSELPFPPTMDLSMGGSAQGPSRPFCTSFEVRNSQVVNSDQDPHPADFPRQSGGMERVGIILRTGERQD